MEVIINVEDIYDCRSSDCLVRCSGLGSDAPGNSRLCKSPEDCQRTGYSENARLSIYTSNRAQYLKHK